MTSINAQQAPTADEIVAFADGALGAAGHEITDPALRELMERYARGEITVDEALAAGRAHIRA